MCGRVLSAVPAEVIGVDMAPEGTPRPVINRLHASIARALKAPDVRALFDKQALAVIGNTPEQFAEMIRQGHKVYANAIKVAGLKPE